METTTALVAVFTTLCVTFLIWTWIIAWHSNKTHNKENHD